jgi:hypothetical protein
MTPDELEANYFLAMAILAEVRAVLLASAVLSVDEKAEWQKLTEENAALVPEMARRICDRFGTNPLS